MEFLRGKFGGYRFWIGGSDLISEGTWLWNDGSPLDWTYWAAPNPDGGTNENCAIWHNSYQAWNSAACWNNRYSVCSVKVCFILITYLMYNVASKLSPKMLNAIVNYFSTNDLQNFKNNFQIFAVQFPLKTVMALFI